MRMIAGILTLVAAVLLAGCSEGSLPEYRYRLTVEVETPEGLKTGSSVIEVSTRVASKNAIISPGRMTMRARGEAVAVELPHGRTMFALLRSETQPNWASNVMAQLTPTYRGDGAAKQKVRAILRMQGEYDLPLYERAGPRRRHMYPMLVTFGDLDDPTSVEKVDPLDLAATFGEGLTLKRITVQVTDDPVTTGIEKRLAWLREYEATWFDGSSTGSQDLTTDALVAQLSATYFSTEIGQ
ncbi:hypothetical protein [Erythrobacter sp. YT30]|uniref:hypothetical protein n=1 Tax=Erythrobacter sp. YT30 TaxID=1735012 RepID=UPI00076C277C|nr:hypothetical protein [Erythrobacter sp. YT30]KWV91262.1 hypothetical protein AUC45_08205 [Erythrobacter sp. YT30]